MEIALPQLGFSGNAGYSWTFFRAGGFDQVKVRNGADIANLDKLDPKLWAALSCPTRGLFFDSKTLDLMDTDKDGRIRVPEVIEAAKWTCSLLKEPDRLLDEAETLQLDQINDATDEGKKILASAKQILLNLGKADATSISIEDTTDTVKIFAQTRFNGDGIVPADAADDLQVKSLIEQMIAIYGPVTDRSGKPGIDAAKLEQFMKDLQAYSDWWNKAEASSPEVWPLGEKTMSAFAALNAVSAKIEDYFARCRLAEYDGRAQLALNRQETEYLVIAAKDLTITSDEVKAFPLAQVHAHRPLPLLDHLNPAWASAMADFVAMVVIPILGEKKDIEESDFRLIKTRLAPYAAWNAQKAGAAVENLGLPMVRQILASDMKSKIEKLIAEDKALEQQANAIALVDKLVHYNRDLFHLLINFVNLRDFYDLDTEPAVFQAGRLYLDQRSCDLCVRVDDTARHALLAPLSRVYLAYCDCVRNGGKDKMTIAAAFTAGDSDNLMVGRNGVFYDREGHDWDATITKVVENPISIGQAFWSPYKRMIRWAEEQIAKRAAAADTAATNTLTTSMGQTVETAAAGQAPKARPKIDIGTVAALGVAVGGITAALGALLQAFFGLGMLMPLGMLGIILMISGPSMVIAWLKLRQRNLGPLLDANGWAVNTRAKINIHFGRMLTSAAKLPPGSKRHLMDPYADSRHGRIWTAAALVLVAASWAFWYFGKVEQYLPGVFPKSSYVLQLEKVEKEKAARDDNIERIGEALQEYVKAHAGQYPASLGELAIDPAVLLFPAGTPADFAKLSREEQVKVLNTNTHYKYIGQAFVASDGAKTVIVNERAKDHSDGAYVLFEDGTVEFMKHPLVDDVLKKRRATTRSTSAPSK